MSFVKRIYSKDLLTVLDFGAETVVALIAEKKGNGTYQIVGAGDSPAHGFQNGEVAHPGDATESIVEALRKVERSSGTSIERLYYNIDDVHMQSVVSRGSKFLTGEGEIRFSDIEEARKVAERLVGHFEKNILYSKEIQFMIDDRDCVENPVGVFGKKLDVFVHVLQARSSHCEAWQRLMTRSQVSKCTPVPSAWSTAYGLLSKENRNGRKLILDLGKDFWSAFVFANDRITSHKILLSPQPGTSSFAQGLSVLVKEFRSLDPDIQEILVTGDKAQDAGSIQDLEAAAGISFRVASPFGIAKLHYPRYASLVGLLHVADELESQLPRLHAEKNILSNIKKRAEAFINEYF